MSRKRRIRALGLHALLIVTTIQGLTPDVRSLASPWTLDRLDNLMAAAGACIPVADRPDPPSQPEHDGASAESVLAGEPGGAPILGRRRPAAWPADLFPPAGSHRPSTGPAHVSTTFLHLVPDANRPALAALCRLTC